MTIRLTVSKADRGQRSEGSGHNETDCILLKYNLRQYTNELECILNSSLPWQRSGFSVCC